jgi:hypothetical protein
MIARGAATARRRAVAAVASVAAAAAVVLAGLGGCAGPLVPRTLRIDEADLAERLAARFPLDRQLLGRYALALADPQLQLLPDEDRLALELTLRVGDLRRPGEAVARVALDFGLRIDAEESALRLTRPRVRRVDLVRADGEARSLGAAALRTAVPLAEAWLDGFVVYRLPPRRAETLRTLGLRPGALRVVPGAVEVTLEPRGTPAAPAAEP